MPKIKILIVEDEKIVAKDIKDSLDSLGYAVCAMISSGEGAVEKIEELKPDLVLMDIMLEGKMNGIQTAEIIRKRFHLPVVYLTAYADQATLERAKISEPFGYIVKPFEDRDLQVAVQMALYKHRMERALKESEEKFRSVFENSTIGIYRTTPDGRILMANPALVHMLGYSSFEKLAERNLEEEGYEPQYLRTVFMEYLESEGKIIGQEAAWVRQNGTTLYVRESAKLLRDDAGNILYYEGTVEDITERKLAEEALAESEERYRTIFELSPEAVVYLDTQGAVLTANKRIYDWLGYDSEKVIGVNAVELPFLTEESKRTIGKNFVRRMKGEDIAPYEIDCITRDGTKEVGRVLANPVLDAEGKVVADLVLIANITEMKQAQEALERKLAYEQALAYCSQILLEVKDPDHAMIGVVEELLPVIGVSRVCIFKNFEDSVDGTCMRLIHEAIAEGFESRLNERPLKHLPYSQISERLLDNLLISDACGGIVSEMPEAERKFLESQGIQSILRVPVRIGSDLWGFFALHDCVNERVWNQEDLDLLQTVASMLGNTIERRHARQALQERVRELDCLYRISSVMVSSPIPLDDVLQDVVDLMPGGWKYPEVACARIIMDEQETKTENFKETAFKLESSIFVQEEQIGVIEVCYLEERPASDEGVFLHEERYLIDAIAERLERLIERRRADEGLRESEEKLSAVVESANQAIISADSKGKIINWNRAAEKMYGYTAEEMLGKPPTLMMPERFREGFAKGIGRAVASGKLSTSGHTMESIALRKDGAEFPVEISFAIWKAGGETFFTTIISDITERKKAEEALRASEEKYRLISENTSDLIAVTTFELNPTYTYVSPSHRALGYEPENLTGKSGLDFVHPDDKKKLLPLLKKYAGAGVKKLLGGKAQGIAERIEYRIKDKWGNWHYLESDVNVVENHILFISRDITERKKASDALRESEERHRILFEEAPDGYYLCDLKGNFIDGNRRIEEITGYKKKELIGKSFLGQKLLSVKELQKTARLLAQNVLGLPTGPDELTLNRKDGSQVPVEITTYPIKLKGEAIVLGIARDITERKKAEEALEEYYESVKFLSETAMGFVKLAPDVDIYQVIEKQLKRLIDEGFVLINSFDAEAEEFTTRAFAGDKKGIEASFKLIGRSVVGARFPITPEARRGLTSGKLEKVQGVFELSGGGMPKAICNAVEKLLGLGRIYAMGFSRKDELFGSAIILLPKGVELKDKNVVETFVNQASVTLQRRQVEQSLKESEEKFRTISASAQDAIIMLDNEANLSYWNEAAERIFGYTREEVLGKEFHTLLTPETYHELYKEGFARFSKAEEGPVIGKTLELSGLRKDGSQFPVELSVSSVKIKGKWHAIGIMRDITERKQAELQLQERARLLDSVRKTNTVDGCLRLACEAVRDAGLFTRAVFTIKNEKGKTTHLAQVGLPPELVERLDRNPPASKEIFKHMIRPEFKISHSYFVPREAGVNFEQSGRYIVQDLEADECPDSWKKGDELFVSMLGMDGSTESYLSVDTPVNGKRPDKATVLYLEDIVDVVARQIHEIYNVNVLRESEERYRAFTEEALVGVYIYQQGKYLLVNRAMAEITGYSEDELLNMEPQTHSLPTDRNSLDKRKEIRKQDTKGSMEYTINIRRKNGETAVLEVRVRSIPYGEKIAYLGNCIDITERVRQREQIEQAREKWERTFDSISDLVMIVDSEGCIQRVNKAVASYTGLDLEDLRGKNYLEVFHLESQKNVREFYTNAVKSKVPASFEIKDPMKEKEFWVSVSPLFSQSENAIATVAVARDITDMRRMEKALMESEMQFRGLAESAQDIIFSIDVDGSILYLNPAFQESLGENPKDFIGTNIKDLFGGFELNADTYKKLNEYLENPEENPVLPLFDLEVRDKKNRKHVLEISVRFLSGQFIGIARDVTERKRMEQQLLRASKFASIGVLAAGLGHQVNNPLASILATSTALREMLMGSGELSDTLGRKMDGYLTAMEQQLDRTHKVVSSLLEFAKEKKMDVMPYNVNHIVREALQFISQHLSFKDISLELSLDEDLPPVSADREALQQVIINVVQNAFEAMEGRGRLAIETETGRKNMIRISISNDGPAIPAEIRDEIFELLFTTKTAQKGTGLGLPISAMLLEHFDARLYLEDSRAGETIFVIEVPIQVRSNR